MAETAPGSLYSLAARVMTPINWPGELGATWADACEAAELDPAGRPGQSEQRQGWLAVPGLDHLGIYGLVLCKDNVGGYWTVVTDDTNLIRGAGVWTPGGGINFAGYEVDPRYVLDIRPGWLAYPRPAGVEALEPPAEELSWALPGLTSHAAQRRSVADRISAEICLERPGTLEDYHRAWDNHESAWGNIPPDPAPPRVVDRRIAVDPDRLGAAASAIAALEAIAQSKLPTGTFRSDPAMFGTTERLRATTETISLVARPDGPAILLLDDDPGQVFEVSHDHQRVAAVLDAIRTATTSS